jgi:hypothetical protein
MDIWLVIVNSFQPIDIRFFMLTCKLFRDIGRVVYQKYLIYHETSNNGGYTTFKGKKYGRYVFDRPVMFVEIFFKDDLEEGLKTVRIGEHYQQMQMQKGKCHGPYEEYHCINEITTIAYITGQYSNGKRDGEWQYYTIPDALNKPQERHIKFIKTFYNDTYSITNMREYANDLMVPFDKIGEMVRYASDGGRVFWGLPDIHKSLDQFLISQNILIYPTLPNFKPDDAVIIHNELWQTALYPRIEIEKFSMGPNQVRAIIFITRIEIGTPPGYKKVMECRRIGIDKYEYNRCYCFIRDGVWVKKEFLSQPSYVEYVIISPSD